MELEDRLVQRFEESVSSFTQTSGNDEVLEKFQNRFPAQDLNSLSLEDYCLGKGSKPENFSWWLERGLEGPLGRFSPGSSRGHIIYRQQDGTFYRPKKLDDLEPEDALTYVLKITKMIATCASLQEAQNLDIDEYIYDQLGLEHRSTMGPARKLRVFNAYHPSEVVCINSQDAIRHYLLELGLEDSKISAGVFGAAKQLMEQYHLLKGEMPGLTPWGFGRLLYDPVIGIRYTRPTTTKISEMVVDDIDAFQRNTIFYGPPGTGKTYRSVSRAVEILDPSFAHKNANNRIALTDRFRSLKDQGRIAFVTFHQSFSYEEFVEGIRAEVDEDNQVQYEIYDGIFKRVCLAAASKTVQKTTKEIDLEERRVWKMSLGNTLGADAYIFDKCISENCILLGYGSGLDYSEAQTNQDVLDRQREVEPSVRAIDYSVTSVATFVLSMKVADLVVVTDGNLKFRAIGEIKSEYKYVSQDEGSHYLQKRDVEWLRVYSPSKPKEELMTRSFSQMTLYELKPGSYDKGKLAGLLVPGSGRQGTLHVGATYKDYSVVKVGREMVQVRKPNGSVVDFSWDLLNTLADMVRRGEITIDDILQKQVFEKVDTHIEKYIVNGYQNILPHLVKDIVGETGSECVASETGDTARVLIIDEINRGNIAKIFGELITLIEDDKRQGKPEELTVTLPYSRDEFSVPSNLFLIGTMNTADRSLTSIDAALRRRFIFEEVSPDPSLLSGTQVEGIEISKVLRAMNLRLEILIGREYLVGHSYLLPLRDDPSLGRLAAIFQLQIVPLLQEYFFDDWARIHSVLGDEDKQYEFQMIQQQLDDGSVSELIGDALGYDLKAWSVNSEAFNQTESYVGIYS